MEGSPEHPSSSKSRDLKRGKCSKIGTFFCSLDISCGDLEQSPAGSVQNHPKSAECETGWKSESDAMEQKVFKVKERATSCGGLCSLVVLEGCSKVGAFPALWWLSGTVYSGECLKVSEKCRM